MEISSSSTKSLKTNRFISQYIIKIVPNKVTTNTSKEQFNFNQEDKYSNPFN